MPNIEDGTRRKRGQVNFNLILFITGHGCYTTYLYKYGHDPNEACPLCLDTSETGEHIFFNCPRGFQVTPDNMVN